MDPTNSYEFTLREVEAIRWALLYLRTHDGQRASPINVDETVALERRLVWRPVMSSEPGS
jgi:hypothetical protein